MSELSTIPALTTAIFLGGVVSGFSGFAFSAVAGVILLHLFEPLLAIPLMMCCSIASQISSLAAIRQHIQWRGSVPLLIGGAGGIPIALYLLTLVDAHVFRISVGIFLACYAVYMLIKPACGIVRQGHKPGRSFDGGFCRSVSRRPDGDARHIAHHLVRPAGRFKRAPKRRSSTIHSNHAGLCRYPAHL